MSRNQKIFIAFLVLAHAAILAFGAYYRFVDGDEGGMLVVSREVIGGRIPILDINAHNQPLLYYFYGGWMKVFGFDIVAARSLSVVAMFLSGLVLLWWAWRFTEDFASTAIVYILFMANLTFFKTNIPVKPFALSNLFTFASFALFSGTYIKDKALRAPVLFISGLLLGLSMGVRLVFILPPVFVLWVIIVSWSNAESVRGLVKKVFSFSAGALIPMVPSMLIYLKEPLRAYTIWAGAYAQVYLGRGNNPDIVKDVHRGMKAEMALRELWDVVRVPDTAFLIIMTILSTAVFISISSRKLDKARSQSYLFAWLVLASIVLVYSNLYMSYLGYVNQIVLFMLILTLPLLKTLSERLGLRKLIAVIVIFLALSAALLYLHFQSRLKTSIFYAFRSNDLVITPQFVDSVSGGVVKKLTKENDTVLDTWGAFVFASGRRPVTGFEYPADNAFFWKLMPIRENAKKYLYIPEPELFAMVERKEIPLVILNNPHEHHKLMAGKDMPDDLDPLRELVERHYVLYRKYFVKPTNAWLLIYLPGKTPPAGIGAKGPKASS